MRPKILIGALLVLAAALVLLWFVRPKPPRQMSPSPEGAQAVADESGTATVSKTESEARPVPPNAPSLSGTVTQHTLESFRARLENAPLTQLWKTPITFYGRVVDQYTNPVPDAQIHFAWTDLSPSGRSETNTQSDTNGLFSLSGVTGRVLEVNVSKQGYYRSRRGTTGFDYGVEYQPDGNPLEFLLHKQGTGADLITSQYGVARDLGFSMPRDGVPVWVDFINRQVGNAGQIELSSIKPPRWEKVKDPSWSLRLSIPDGGLIEHDDEFAFEAPQSGYQPTIEFHFKAGETNWGETLQKKFYIAFGEPRRYGRITIDTGIYMGMNLGYAINPAGSRNLESRPPAPSPRRQLPPGGVEVGPGDPVPR